MHKINSKVITAFITLFWLCYTSSLCIDSVECKINSIGRNVFSIGKFNLKGCNLKINKETLSSDLSTADHTIVSKTASNSCSVTSANGWCENLYLFHNGSSLSNSIRFIVVSSWSHSRFNVNKNSCFIINANRWS